jgi:D-aminoacyl-tRNA deacylase
MEPEPVTFSILIVFLLLIHPTMRAVIQRVSQASVKVNQEVVGEIQQGLCVLLGIHRDDSVDKIPWLAEKITGLRIFEDSEGKMNLSLEEVKGSMLIVSQFTLYGDCQKGRRPSFIEAARPEIAIPLYEKFIHSVKMLGIPVQTGIFGAQMQVELVNQGPVTIILDTPSD